MGYQISDRRRQRGVSIERPKATKDGRLTRSKQSSSLTASVREDSSLNTLDGKLRSGSSEAEHSSFHSPISQNSPSLTGVIATPGATTTNRHGLNDAVEKGWS